MKTGSLLLVVMLFGVVVLSYSHAVKDTTGAFLGLGVLIVGSTAMILIKLNQLIDAIHSSGDKVETVLKQRLH